MDSLTLAFRPGYDFVLEKGTWNIRLFKVGISEWRITFADTRVHSEIELGKRPA
jgi:hypothetical protein